MRILITTFALIACALFTATGQVRPEPRAQKQAMQKLNFLVGTWTGEAVIQTSGKQMTIQQTETVQYKLDGLVMVIEGSGRDADGKVVFQALGVVSFDQQTGTFHIRAWNEGNFVETEAKVEPNQFEWGFQRGPVTVLDRLVIDEQGRWKEVSEASLQDGRKVHTVTMSLTRQSGGTGK